MNTPSLFGIINIAAFSFGAILVCLTCLVYMALRIRLDKSQSKLLLIVIIDVLVNAICSMTAEVLKGSMLVSDVAAAAVYVSNYLYFIAHTALAPMVCVYFLTVCGRSTKRNTVVYVVTSAPFFIAELLAITNPFTHWVYYYGPDLAFTRNWAMYVLYAVAAYYILFGVATLLVRWRALTHAKRRAIVYFFLMVIFGVAVQLIEPEVRIELLAESVAILGVMLFIENEDEFIDSETGVYNRNALKANIDALIDPRNPLYVIVVRVTNANAFTRITGSTQARQYMVSVVSEHIQTIVPWYRVYRTAPAQYALFDSTIDEKGALEIASIISERFERSWDYHGVAIDLHAVVSVACIPEDLGTSDDIFYFIDSPIPVLEEKKVLGRGDLDYLLRQAEVERAVERGLAEANYEVYYQPVYNAQGKISGAEALMRLHDTVLGDIPPDEFIAVAERIDCIESIGEFALREVCAFWASGVPQRLGFTRISVNLSVIQCMNSDFPARIRAISGEYGVSPKVISFEITESVAAENYEFLARMMRRISSDGHRFAMDDYGTGYSNLHSLMTLDFDTVKIDKSVLWDAEKSDMGMAILENSVNLLRSIDRLVLVEGVETQEQHDMLQRMGVDYYQGYYFARPMPKDEFVAFVEQHRV